jgi:hypothetical protein
MGKRDRESRNIIGARVKEARQSHNPPLTQDQLSGKLAAQGLQLDRVAIAKIETPFRCAFDFEVKALAAVFQVDAKWLLGLEKMARSQTARRQGKRKASL